MNHLRISLVEPAWPELYAKRGQVVESQAPNCIAALGGTGPIQARSVCVRIDLPNGTVAIATTSLKLWHTCADAIEAAMGDPRAPINQAGDPAGSLDYWHGRTLGLLAYLTQARVPGDSIDPGLRQFITLLASPSPPSAESAASPSAVGAAHGRKDAELLLSTRPDARAVSHLLAQCLGRQVGA